MKQQDKERLIEILGEALVILEEKKTMPLKEGFKICPVCSRQSRGTHCWNCSSPL